jgi:membrane fusion protein
MHDELYSPTDFRLPLRWHVIALLLLATLVAALFFLVTASFPRTEAATGIVQPGGGILQVVASRSGRVTEVLVKEGQWVQKGQRLASIVVEDADQSGTSPQQAMLDALSSQDQHLQSQTLMDKKAADALQREYGTQAAGLRLELVALDQQIAFSQKLVALAETNLRQAREVAQRGFISQRDLDTREEELLLKQQQLSSLEQSKVAKAASLKQIETTNRRAAIEASVSHSERESSRAELGKQVASINAQRGYSLVAPAAGQVTGVTLHVGDAVQAQLPLMMIVPPGKEMVARLSIPGNAIAFVHAGQRVNLALDAFPHERFGTIPATIESVSLAPSVKTVGEPGKPVTTYLASARMDRLAFRAYGGSQPLRPGMTFSARIALERRSVAGWLLDPLLAAAD